MHGRALARNGSVTLINDHFTTPTCATSLPDADDDARTGDDRRARRPTTFPAVSPRSTAPGAGRSRRRRGARPRRSVSRSGIVGPPRTGVAPLPTHDFPWPAVLFAGSRRGRDARV